MTTLLSLPGRYGDTQIDHMEFGAMRELAAKGSSRSIVEQAWTAVKDWFCGTKVGEAKECLLKLYSSKTSDGEKLLAFRELKELASLPFKERLVEYGNSIWIFTSRDAAIFKHSITDPSVIDNSSIGRDSIVRHVVDSDSIVYDSTAHVAYILPYHESFFPRAHLASFGLSESPFSVEDGMRPLSEHLALFVGVVD